MLYIPVFSNDLPIPIQSHLQLPVTILSRCGPLCLKVIRTWIHRMTQRFLPFMSWITFLKRRCSYITAHILCALHVEHTVRRQWRKCSIPSLTSFIPSVLFPESSIHTIAPMACI